MDSIAPILRSQPAVGKRILVSVRDSLLGMSVRSGGSDEATLLSTVRHKCLLGENDDLGRLFMRLLFIQLLILQ